MQSAINYLKMSKKIFFNVVFVSDEEPNFPANELLTHNPDCFGWQSDKSNSSFPKEIVLRFHSPSKIYKIQVRHSNEI